MPARPEAHQQFRALLQLPDDAIQAHCRALPVSQLLEMLLAGAEQLETLVDEFGRNLRGDDCGELRAHADSRAQLEALLGRLKA